MGETVEEGYNIKFTKKDGGYKEYFEKMYQFGRFLSLLCNTPIELVDEFCIELSDRKLITVKIKNWVKDKEIQRRDVISYSEIKNNFQNIIQGYYNLVASKPQSISVLATSLYSSNAPGSSVGDFLNITRAIDALYENIVWDISVEKEKRGGEFKTKIAQLLIESEFLTSYNIDVNKIADVVRDTRNYYTHFEKKKDKKSRTYFKENYLSFINAMLYYLLLFRLLKFWNNEARIRVSHSQFNMIKLKMPTVFANIEEITITEK
jgi:hypothetical protein